MKSLEEYLVERIHPEVSPLWAVADADGLFRNDEVEGVLAARGAEVVPFEDPIAFRFLYETTMRDRIETGDPVCYVVLVDPGNDGFRQLPADVCEAARQVEIALGDVFPKLSRTVLRELEPSVLSLLWEKRAQIPDASQSDRDTADLVFRLCYRIEPSLIESFNDFIRTLIELHFNGRHLPECLAKRLEQVAGGTYSNRLGELIRNPGAFWTFMQQEWEGWLKEGEPKVKDRRYEAVDFTDNHIRVYVDNLFLEGFLKPVPASEVTKKSVEAWCWVGVASESATLDESELVSQREHLIGTIPGDDASYQDWLRFAGRYSQHVAACFTSDRDSRQLQDFWEALWGPMDSRFQSWIQQRFDSLHNLPPTRPVVCHHIPKFLTRRMANDGKVLLLLLDGLSLSQWKVVKDELQDTFHSLSVTEDQCFVHVPSVTNVCRQAIFAGELPIFFESSIARTNADEKRWKLFWDGAMGKPVKSAHVNVQGQDGDREKVEETLLCGARAVGVTVRMPDEIMHGATMGWRGMLQQVRLWARQSFLSGTIQSAIQQGFQVFLTADHGNLEAIGQGSPSEGVLVDRSGQRVRVYPDVTIRDHAAKNLGARACSWKSKTLPESYLPVLHTGRGAFVPPGQILVCHGGISLDEMIVPFIEFSQASTL